jgi:hypothetical protein
MVNCADKIVIIGEKDSWPDYLKKSDKVIYWDVGDPFHMGLDGHRKTMNEIEKLVRSLLDGLEC